MRREEWRHLPWSLSDIDALLDADKALFGVTEWIEEGPVVKLANAVVGPDNAIIGGLSLRIHALLHVTPQRGSAVLVLDERPIQRMSFLPDHSHTNPGRHPTPPQLRFLVLPAGRSREYLWTHNREWPRHDNVLAGSFVKPDPPSIEAAIAQFVERCGITAYIPPPPWSPQLEL